MKTTTKHTATFYAIEHRYGATVLDDRGNHIGAVHAFASAETRDAWVRACRVNQNDRGARTVLLTLTPRDRRAIMHALIDGAVQDHAPEAAPASQDGAEGRGAPSHA